MTVFTLIWTDAAQTIYDELKQAAEKHLHSQQGKRKPKSSKQAGLFKQVHKALALLQDNPRHPSLQTHEYDSIENPYDKKKKVFEAYAQNKTPGAYRIFWCFGPEKEEITIIAITPNP